MLRTCRNALTRRIPLTKPLTVSSRRFNGTLSTPKPQVIVSGIQPTGIPHIGNYLGALQQWVRLQNESPPGTKLLFSVVDLHAYTLRQDPAVLKRWKRETMGILLAIGLDPEKVVLFFQSSVCVRMETTEWRQK